MIVEFIGMPASGKTTLAKKLYAQTELCGLPIKYPLKTLYEQPWLQRNTKKSLTMALYTLTHLFTATKLLLMLIKSRQGAKDVAKLFFNNMFFLSQRNALRKNAIYIFDEGVFHYAWAMLARAKRPLSIESLLNNCPMPDALICVDTPSKELRRRYEKRKARGVTTDRHEEIFSNIEALSARITELTNCAEARNVRVIRLKNDATRREEINSQAMIEFLKEALS